MIMATNKHFNQRMEWILCKDLFVSRGDRIGAAI